MLVNIKSRAARAAREQALTEFAIRLIEDVPLTRLPCLQNGVTRSVDQSSDPLCVLSEGLFCFSLLRIKFKGGTGCRSPPPCFGLLGNQSKGEG